MGYPKVTCDLRKLLENVNSLADVLHAGNRTFAASAKYFCADPYIIGMLDQSRCDWIADSRVQNIRAYKTEKPRFLLRIAQVWEIPEVVEFCEYSFQSEPATIAILGAEAKKRGKKHGVLLALDVGDLREGCFFRNEADIMRTAESVLHEDALELVGVGTNIGCFGGVRCSKENMTTICDIAEKIRKAYRISLPYVSGMSTLCHEMLLSGKMPKGVTHGRFGEYWACGMDSVNGIAVPGMHNDAFIMSTQVVEVKEKASKPIGSIGADAFGNVIERPDRGPMRRGIVAIGAQDSDFNYLFPLDERIEILGGSSDHMILNLSRVPEVKPGDTIRFRMGWSAVMRAFTSPFVKREFVGLC